MTKPELDKLAASKGLSVDWSTYPRDGVVRLFRQPGGEIDGWYGSPFPKPRRLIVGMVAGLIGGVKA